MGQGELKAAEASGFQDGVMEPDGFRSPAALFCSLGDFNSIIAFRDRDDVLALLIHLGYMEELPSGDGYVDIVYLPKHSLPMPALVIELKWKHSVQGAIARIKDRRYPVVLSGYGGDILLVGIAYDREAGKRKHTCVIEKV